MAQEMSQAKNGTPQRSTHGMPQRSDDDRALVETQNWASRSHPELYASVHQDNDPGRVGELAQQWQHMGQQIQDASKTMADRMAKTEDGWVGEAADSARHAIRELANWGDEAGNTAGQMSQTVSQQGQIMEKARASMPEPVDAQPQEAHYKAFASGNLAFFAVAATDLKAKQDQSKSAHEQAVTVMTQMESDSRSVDGAVPKFVPPPDPIEQATPAMKATQRTEPGSGTAPGDNGVPPTAGGQPSLQANGQPPSSAPGQPGNSSVPSQDTLSSNPSDMPGGPGAPGGSDMPGGPGSPGGPGAPGGPDTSGGMSLKGGGPGSGQSGGGIPELNVPETPDLNTSSSSPDGQSSSLDLSDYEPDSTSSQSTTPKLPSSIPNTSGLDDIPRTPRTPTLPDTQLGLGGQSLTGSDPGKNKRTSWSGSVPNLPSGGSSGGSLSTGGGLSSSLGGSTGAGSGSGLSAGGRSSTGAVPGGGRVPTEGVGTGRAATGSGGSGMAGGVPGAGARGQEQEEKTRSNKYLESEQLFEVPGADLPPPVIGAGKPKKKQQPAEQEGQEQ